MINRMTKLLLLLLCVAIDNGGERAVAGQIFVGRSNQTVLEFSVEFNRKVYELTNIGEPPQLAIWIESTNGAAVRTVWVSRRAGKNQWRGKVECPVALPYWESRMRSGSTAVTGPANWRAAVDAVSSATPKDDQIVATISIPAGTTWNYFMEVNVASDYNKSFPYWSADGLPDSQANGQPSIVYSGELNAAGVRSGSIDLLGRTLQLQPTDSLLSDVSGITTAGQVLSKIEVRRLP